MKKIILTLSLFSLFAGGLHAGPVITYQGRLKSSGAPVSANKSFGFEFCATPAGTGCVPSVDGSQSFQVANGLFKSTFTAPAVDLAAGPWYLRVSVDGTPLLPLEQLTMVPYAVQAASSAYASALAVTSGAGVVASTHVIVMGGISVGDWAVVPSSEAVFQALGLGQDLNPGAEDIKVAVMGYARSASADALDLVAGGNFEAEIPSGMNGALVGLRSVNRNYGSAGMAIGMMVDSLQNTGTIAETYGLMIGTMTAGTQVNRPYAIYSHDPNARTYFAGQVGISSRTPSYSLAVSSASGDLFWVAQDGAHSTKYWGDGSGLTGVTGASGTDNTKVLKTGDTMSGQLTLAGSTLTVVDASGASPGVLWVSTSFSQPILFVSSRGFAGINTAAPLYPLHLSSRQGQTALQIDGHDAGWDTIAIDSKNSGQPNISYVRGGLLKANTFVDGSNNFKLRVNGADTLTATPLGKVGIGNTDPLYALHVSSGAGETGIVFAVSTGASHVFWAAGDGAHATAFYGNGSGLTGVTASGAVQKTGDTMTGTLTVNSNTGVSSTDLVTNGIVVSTGGAIATTGLGNGTVAGDARGMGAVDLQTFRTAITEVASGAYSVIGGGQLNTAGNDYATVSGGSANNVSGTYAAAGGGQNHVVSGSYAGAFSGYYSSIAGNYAFIGGGFQNAITIAGVDSAIAGGMNNKISAAYAAIGGGRQNIVSGQDAVVPGGFNNSALGNYSFAAGSKSSSTAQGAFTWQDSGGSTINLINNVTDRTIFKSRGGFIVTGSTDTAISGTQNRAVLITGAGLVGIATGAPQAALDVVADGFGAGVQAQIWRTGSGVIVGSMSATGSMTAARYVGDGSGLTGVTGASGTDATKVLKTGDTMTGSLLIAGSSLAVVAVETNRFSLWASTSAAVPHLFVSTAGKVGVGTEFPGAQLTVNSAIGLNYSVPALIVGNPNGAAEVTAGKSSTQRTSMGWNNGGYGEFNSIGGALLINASGQDVGVGALNAQSRFSVQGPGSAYVLYVSSSSSGLPAQLAVTNSGNVGISTAAPTHKLAVAGGILATSSITALGGFYGDGSGLSNLTGDNLGNHTAAQVLQMGAYGVNTSSHVTAARYQIGGSTVLALSGVSSFSAGIDAGKVNTGSYSTFLGYFAGAVNTGGNYNSYLGFNAGSANTLGAFNSMAGAYAGSANTTGGSNAYFGYRAGSNSQIGSANSNFGADAGLGFAGSSFSSSTIVGYRAGYNLTNGSNNILLGYQAGYAVTTGAGNIVIGYNQGTQNAAANNELNIGGLLFGDLAAGTIGISTRAPQAALDIVSTGTAANIYAQIWRSGAGVAVASITSQGKLYADGSGLTGVPGDGLGSHVATTTLNMSAFHIVNVDSMSAAGNITAARYQINGSTVLALSGTDSLGVGVQAGRVNSGDGNTFVGFQAGKVNTSGFQNSFLGNLAGTLNTTGYDNSFVGYQAGAANTTGTQNSFSGYQAGLSNTTGWYNSFYGVFAGLFTKTGSANAIFGAHAGYGATGQSFSSSTLLGYQAGYGLTTGSDNILLGYQAGYAVTTGSGNIVIGYSQDTQGAAANNQLNIGGLLFGDLAAGTIGISTRAPQAALDIVAPGTYAQIWRNSAGVQVASLTATGIYYGNGSGLTGVSAADPSKLPLAGGALTGPVDFNSNITIYGAATFISSITALGSNQFGDAVADTHGVNMAPEAGTALAVNGTGTSGDNVAKFYSNGSLVMGLRKK
ncbi:MAG: hypothetical protein A2X35_11415 [Elusimicrobia bacterium GWA2_61_42]|nr:MAG: hypothetical protein A2X35_11415 [Elusimicrobia bacterium GWA2_61_42]OGR75853.1 MAG: hypothetical protein A2X38_07500 [Elusimicrobia bacterium GWC2_61_25]